MSSGGHTESFPRAWVGQLNREPACGPVQGKQSLEAGLRTLLGSGRQYDMVSLTAAAVSPGVRNARLEAGLSLLRPGGVLLLHDVLPPPAAGAGPHTMDYDPTRWPQSPRIVMRCAPRASNGPNRLGLCALQARPPATPTGTGSRRFTRNSGRTRAGCLRPQCVSHPAFRCVSVEVLCPRPFVGCAQSAACRLAARLSPNIDWTPSYPTPLGRCHQTFTRPSGWPASPRMLFSQELLAHTRLFSL